MSESKEIRRTGRTTRLVDAGIQTLFTEGKVKFQDHEAHVHASKFLGDRIKKRLALEHRLVATSKMRNGDLLFSKYSVDELEFCEEFKKLLGIKSES